MDKRQPFDQLDGIAVIGMSGRFPGARTIEEFWENLCAGRESITRFSDEELLEAGVRPEITNHPMYVKAKGVIEGIDLFDADFFGYSPRDAKTIDPQQRLFLECAWEALERAGYDPGRYRGRIGVYAGATLNTYLLATRLFTQISLLGDPVSTIVGSDKDFLATRVSYKLNLRGPSVTIQTACSTSLVAVHMACQSLLSGESTMALAGGVSVRIPQKEGYMYQGDGIASPDGHCRAFDAQGQGTVIGEGVGIVVLKRLEDALAAKDHVWAVIKGSAINNDGAAKMSYTAPGLQGQVEVIEEAMAIADIDPETVSYIEAHGTGTSLGDPLEVAALTQVFRSSTAEKGFCALGSVKTNIGHLDAAAGVAGLIKTVLMLSHKRLPPSLHFAQPNPHIDFANSPFYVNTTLTEWRGGKHPRRAGVSSFGIGGTNAHVLLEEAPVDLESASMQRRPTQEKLAYMLPLSAHSIPALQALARSYADWLQRHEEIAVRDICAAASLRRSQHIYRLSLVGHSQQMLAEQARHFLHAELPARSARSTHHKVVFVCPGQGSQWKGMAHVLLEQEPVFRQQMQRCEDALRRFVSWSLLEYVLAEVEWQDIAILQPTLFAIQVSLAALWQSWGIKPDAIIGHSMGEVAASFIAGVLSLEEAARVICERSQLLQRIQGKGAMILAELTQAQAEEVLRGCEQQASIAACNSPRSTTLAGEPEALEAIGSRLKEQGVFWRWIKVDVASHSPQVDELREDLLDVLTGLQPAAADIAFYSTVSGQQMSGMELDASYWVKNLREPVQFSSVVQHMLNNGYNTFIELSPHPLLITSIQENLEDLGKEATVLPSMRRGQNERGVMLQTLGTLYAYGMSVNWTVLYPDGSRSVALPTYPFQRQRYWIEPHEFAAPEKSDLAGTPSAGHPLLGQRIRSPLRQIIFESQFSRARLPLVNDYFIHDMATVPATVYTAMAFDAVREIYGSKVYQLEELEVQKQLFLAAEEVRTVCTVVTPGDMETGSAFIQIYSTIPDEEAEASEIWEQHACCTLRFCDIETQTPLSFLEVQAMCQLEGAARDISFQSYADGITHGSNLQVIQELRRGPGVALARIQFPETAVESTSDRIPLLLLEIGAQVMDAALGERNQRQRQHNPYLPACMQRMHTYTPMRKPLWCYATVKQQEQGLVGELAFFDEQKEITASVTGLRLDCLTPTITRRLMKARCEDWFYEVRWDALPPLKTLERSMHEAGVWLILADRAGVGVALASELMEHGAQVHIARQGEAFAVDKEGQYAINSECPEDFQRLLEEIAELNKRPCQGILHLWNLDAPSTNGLTVDALEEAQMVGCGSILSLMPVLVSRQQEPPPKLWLVTCGAQPIGECVEKLAVAQATVWGLGQVIAIEHPDIWGGQIDLDPDSVPGDSTALIKELLVPDGEDQIVLRRNVRYGARLIRRSRSERRAVQWHTHGIYLVTGGLGQLGLQVAHWLVEQGVRHVWLLNRTELSEESAVAHEKRERIRSLEDMGATVRILQVDVGDVTSMTGLTEALKVAQMPLCGVVHAAGVAEPRELITPDRHLFQAMLRPKVRGTWLLHQLTQQHPVDFFISFSSIVALWGSRGLAYHAAVNRFLDAFSHYRHAQGYPALSINWGPWMGGLHGSLEAQSRLDLLGIEPFLPEQGMAALDACIDMDVAQIAIARMDWSRFKPGYEARTRRHLLDQMHLQIPSVSQHRAAHDSTLWRLLDEVQPAERREIVLAFVWREVAAVLGLEGSQSLNSRRPLRELGLESLMAIELRNRLQAGVGAAFPIPSTIVFMYPTIDALVDFLMQNMPPASASVEMHSGIQQPQEEQEGMADEDVTASLLEELERAGY